MGRGTQAEDLLYGEPRQRRRTAAHPDFSRGYETSWIDVNVGGSYVFYVVSLKGPPLSPEIIRVIDSASQELLSIAPADPLLGAISRHLRTLKALEDKPISLTLAPLELGRIRSFAERTGLDACASLFSALLEMMPDRDPDGNVLR